MKCRLGFVSNSSSSSFIIIGRRISPSEIHDYHHVWFIGSEYGEGTDAFEIEENDNLLKDAIANTNVNGTLMSAVKTFCGDDYSRITRDDLEEMLKLSDINGDIEIMAFDKSYYNTYDNDGLADFIERYIQK